MEYQSKESGYPEKVSRRKFIRQTTTTTISIAGSELITLSAENNT
jgi:hypothetical protein